MKKNILLLSIVSGVLLAYEQDDARFVEMSAMEKEMVLLQKQSELLEAEIARKKQAAETFGTLVAIQEDLLSQIRGGNFRPSSAIGKRTTGLPMVLYAEDFGKGFRPPNDERCTSFLQDSPEGQVLEITKGMWTRHLPLSTICGRRIRVSCECRLHGTPVPQARGGWGGKVMFLEKTPKGGKWHGIAVNPNDSGWQPLVFECQLSFELTEGHLSIGLQDFTGSLQLRKLVVTVVPDVPQGRLNHAD
ncbi:MAG: hypothetical protein IJJ26_11360 [Victivallales bacterium]|nr:hypothetical protein [Victivallales bacterium]